jgi:Skp family chaperone for outer membrane proteins
MTHASRFVRTALVAGAVLLGVTSQYSATAAPPQQQPAGPAPQARVLVIDRAAILRFSKVGQDIARQVNVYTTQAQNDLKGQEMALRKDGQALQQQLAILSADVKAKKIKDFEAREAGLQQKAQQKQSLIQGGVYKARQQVEQALQPILQGVMQERGANMLLDRGAVLLGIGNMDVTPLVIQRLDQKLPALKVELVPLPANVQPQ